jgi:membrane-bound serine protease (ClpP class)
MPIVGTLPAVLTDPNVVYLLFLIGILGVVAESYHPGTILPGVLGGIALILALLGFAATAVNPLGIVLVLAGIGLLIAEVHTPGLGVLGASGIAAFIAGSLLLFLPVGARLSVWLIALGTLGVASYILFMLRAVLRARHMPVTSGSEALLGQEGVAVSDLAPRGTVRVAHEDWTAVADLNPIEAGETVEVVAVEGVTLRVRRPYEWKLPPASTDQVTSNQ